MYETREHFLNIPLRQTPSPNSLRPHRLNSTLPSNSLHPTIKFKTLYKSSPKCTSHSSSTMTIISLLFTSLLLLIHPTPSASDHHHHPRRRSIHPPSIKNTPSSSDLTHQACSATRNPQLCESSLIHYPTGTPTEIIQSALTISSNNLKQAQSMSQTILESASGNINKTTAAKNCIEHLNNSAYRLKSTADALPRGDLKNARAWTSAGLAYQYDCWSALKYVNDTKTINETMSFLNTLIGYTSNALSLMMAYDVFGDKTTSWAPPKTEREGFWEVGGSGGGAPELGVLAGLKADVTVCKGGGCDYVTVQEAVNAGPDWGYDRRFVIWVKTGVYEETVRVGLEKVNVVVLGDGMGKTVITGSLNVGQPGLSTYNTATFGVVGDGFMASGLTIENTAGPDAHQAVAFRSDSDRSIIENCEFLGNQDTLYAHSLRQFYKSCRIEGNVDFIFGNSASIFQDCSILIRPRQQNPEKGENNAVTAHGRIDPAQSTGFVFQNCLINGTEEYMRLYNSNPKVHKNFLGRPWKEFSRTVFIDCNMEALITPQGWMPWTGDFALKTLYYGEFENSGKGSDLSGRVAWSSRIPAEHVNVYSVGNFLQGFPSPPALQPLVSYAATKTAAQFFRPSRYTLQSYRSAYFLCSLMVSSFMIV
ncbi:putative pectinesterase [Helianthus annuus]|uniref:pectinesterase n=1 Tax=Helianthus annuus TaxID=4232 RepID=A0A251SAA7_HELAN|nr:putative pectinesterase [Helianthus annuus]KAJ0456684.1 putative pectinesterase [Helianthus annuus]KAJ0832114.1 putative pectinesterase [Helianthus annuus]KAJ0845639.1 putative pectinesterase [Helianthus annuus]